VSETRGEAKTVNDENTATRISKILDFIYLYF
jgi:hypothetical protein